MVPAGRTRDTAWPHLIRTTSSEPDRVSGRAQRQASPSASGERVPFGGGGQGQEAPQADTQRRHHRSHRRGDHPHRVPHQLEQPNNKSTRRRPRPPRRRPRRPRPPHPRRTRSAGGRQQGRCRRRLPRHTSTRVNTQKYSAAPPMTIDPSKNYTATVVTTAGTFTIALDAKTAPVTVNNFVFLADKGFYHCVIFHRVIPSFMDQTGDPTGTGTGWSRATRSPTSCRPRRPTPPPSTRWARSPWPTPASPTPGGSQFFIVAGPAG